MIWFCEFLQFPEAIEEIRDIEDIVIDSINIYRHYDLKIKTSEDFASLKNKITQILNVPVVDERLWVGYFFSNSSVIKIDANYELESFIELYPLLAQVNVGEYPN